MAVKKDRGFARSIERLSVHERVQGGRYDFTRLKSGETQVVSDPASGAFDVRLVFGLGADTGDTKKFVQFGEILVAA